MRRAKLLSCMFFVGKWLKFGQTVYGWLQQNGSF